MTHVFTKSEIKQAEHEFAEMIKKYFGEVWRIAWNGEYRGKSWECRSMLTLDTGLWTLCQHVIHAGGKRAAGRIDSKDAGEALLFTILYEPTELIVKPEIIQ